MADEPVTGPMFIPIQPGRPAPHIKLFWDKDLQPNTGGGHAPIELGGEACSYVGDRFNDQASSLIVYSGVWRLYQDINFNRGSHGGTPVTDYIEVGPGTYGYIGDIYFQGRRAGDHWNDALTSLEPIEYTDPPRAPGQP